MIPNTTEVQKQSPAIMNCRTLFNRDPGGIQTPNPQSRNLMRYSVAPRSHSFGDKVQLNPF